MDIIQYVPDIGTLKISYENSMIDIPKVGEVRLRAGSYEDLSNMFLKLFFEPKKGMVRLNDTILVDTDNFNIKYIRGDVAPRWWQEFQIYFNRVLSLKTFW